MTDRAWAFVNGETDAGAKRNGIRIECADCDASAFFSPNSGGRFPPKAAETHFRRDGWTVGNGPRRDFCPKCTSQKTEKAKVSNVVDLPKPKSPSETAPRVMTRDDRRLIIAEVKGCYDEGNKRYMDGWHDERVAQALGAHVPVAWVKECREDYFGEGASNEQFDELLKRVGYIDTELSNLEKNEMRLSAAIAELKKALDGLKPLVREVQRAIGK